MKKENRTIFNEEERLNSEGISYDRVVCRTVDYPVAYVKKGQLDRLVEIAKNDIIRGRFISINDDGSYDAFYQDNDGIIHYKTGLKTERESNRYVLGFDIGRLKEIQMQNRLKAQLVEIYGSA